MVPSLLCGVGSLCVILCVCITLFALSALRGKVSYVGVSQAPGLTVRRHAQIRVHQLLLIIPGGNNASPKLLSGCSVATTVPPQVKRLSKPNAVHPSEMLKDMVRRKSTADAPRGRSVSVSVPEHRAPADRVDDLRQYWLCQPGNVRPIARTSWWNHSGFLSKRKAVCLQSVVGG